VYDSWSYQIPAITSEANRIREKVHISLGIITDVYVGFPAGCASYDVATDTTYRLARMRLLRAAEPILPRSKGTYLAADDFVVHAGPLQFPVLKGDPVLTWELWNLDDTYPHELWLGVNWLTKEELEKAIDAMKETSLETRTLRQMLQRFFLIPGA
jgi:hypothetical protein